METLVPLRATDKRVCIINTETKMIMRVSKEYAKHAVAAGMAHYTTKGALKKFMNRDMKLMRNDRTVERAQAGVAESGLKGKYKKRVPHNNRLVGLVTTFKSITGRTYYAINGWGNQYSNHYGGDQILVKSF